MEDQELLRRYVTDQSEDAFKTLVQRHVDLVYSCALRKVHNHGMAQDITQAVFIIFARKASTLSRSVVLCGWFYRTTHFVATRALRSEVRRHQREKEAMDLQRTGQETDWEELWPRVEGALLKLGEADRNAILLRYFQQKDTETVAGTLQISREAAQKRISRAVARLRSILVAEGARISGVALVAFLSTGVTQAAPGSLAGAVVAGCLGQAVIPTGASELVHATLQQGFLAKAGAALTTTAAIAIVAVTLSRSEYPTDNADEFRFEKVINTRVQGSAPAPGSVPANINVQLLGDPGLGFRMKYVADGQGEFSTNGVLPATVRFQADAFSIHINVRERGNFGYQLSRNGMVMALATPQTGVARTYQLEGKKGGTGISGISHQGEEQ